MEMSMTGAEGSERDRTRAEIGRISLDQELMTALQDPAHPGHRTASDHRRALYAAAFSDSTGTESGGVEGITQDEDKFFSPPADAKEYRFDPVPHGLTYDSALDQKARGWFHQAGMPQWLARNVVREWNRSVEQAPDAHQIAADAARAEQSLRKSWGRNYETKVTAARELLRSLKSDEAIDLLDRSGLANNEYLIRQLAALAEGRQAGARS